MRTDHTGQWSFARNKMCCSCGADASCPLMGTPADVDDTQRPKITWPDGQTTPLCILAQAPVLTPA